MGTEVLDPGRELSELELEKAKLFFLFPKEGDDRIIHHTPDDSLEGDMQEVLVVDDANKPVKYSATESYQMICMKAVELQRLCFRSSSIIGDSSVQPYSATSTLAKKAIENMNAIYDLLFNGTEQTEDGITKLTSQEIYQKLIEKGFLYQNPNIKNEADATRLINLLQRKIATLQIEFSKREERFNIEGGLSSPILTRSGKYKFKIKSKENPIKDSVVNKGKNSSSVIEIIPDFRAKDGKILAFKQASYDDHMTKRYDRIVALSTQFEEYSRSNNSTSAEEDNSPKDAVEELSDDATKSITSTTEKPRQDNVFVRAAKKMRAAISSMKKRFSNIATNGGLPKKLDKGPTV